ncbi:hypothetical protein C1H46_034552 [Malus baccata]|uniref:Uncharacterized protein n=1 Tax=Malus baccata TaxID=106549 RepID=A0A540L078_MALBA|nr:hypothetical protein C1H46_034552 [Malus baccata]
MGSGRKGNIPRGFLSPLLCMERHLSVAQKLPVLPVLVCHLSRNLPIPVTSQVFLLIMETVVLSVQLHLLLVLPMIIRFAPFALRIRKTWPLVAGIRHVANADKIFSRAQYAEVQSKPG